MSNTEPEQSPPQPWETPNEEPIARELEHEEPQPAPDPKPKPRKKAASKRR